MKISVIIPAYNEEKLLGASLRSIKAAMEVFTASGVESELIVCDNNSTDRTGDIARAEGAKVVFEPFNQIATARNTGASIATGDWFIFVDADSNPSTGLFRECLNAIQSGKVLAGGSLIQMESEKAWMRFIVRMWNRLSAFRKLAAGSFIFCDAKAFREVGGFNTKFFVSEELHLTVALKKIARREKKKFVILHKNPLVTSARKADLYTLGDMIRLLAKTFFTFGRTWKRREDCAIWYDGRR